MRVFGVLACLIALVATGYSAIMIKAPRIQADIQTRTEEALAEAANGPVEVVVDGRHITLSGTVRDEEERQVLLRLAGTVWGGLGPIDRLERLAVMTPYRFEATKEESGEIAIEGFAPDIETRDLILADARTIFGNDAEVTIDLAAGAPEGDWRTATGLGMDALASLNQGRLVITDKDVLLASDGPGPHDVEAIDIFSEAAPEGFTWINDLPSPRREDGQEPAAASDNPASTEEVPPPVAADDGEGGEDAEDALASVKGDPAEDPEAIAANADEPTEQASKAGAAQEEPSLAAAPVVSPYVMTIGKSEDGILSMQGVLPDEAARDQLVAALRETMGGADIAVQLDFADGMPGDDWPAFIADRAMALKAVRSGSLSFSDYESHLLGRVDTPEDIEPVRTKLAAVDSTMAIELDPIDSRSWAALDLVVSPDRGVTLWGKLPQGLTEPEVARALGLVDYKGGLSEDGRGDADAWREDLVVIGSYLPQFEHVGVTLSDDKARIKGKLLANSDVDQVTEGLAGLFPEDQATEVEISTTELVYEDGAQRKNPLTGIDEVYDRGYWLPIVGFAAELGECRQRSSAILDAGKITFLRGDATLDARARKIVDSLAAVAINCLGRDGLALEIGGHTDSRGEADMNQALSQSRADAVLEALQARGVSEASVAAVGYGETEPIADNETREGRALNRRITFEWKKSDERKGSEPKG